MRKHFSSRELEIFSELHSLGYSQEKIAKLGEVSQATISRILRAPKQDEMSQMSGKKKKRK